MSDEADKSREPETEPVTSDDEAEAAVRAAFKNLATSGKPAYSLSVPIAAENVLVAYGQGTITPAEAGKRTRRAMDAMIKRGQLEAYAEGYKDWKLK